MKIKNCKNAANKTKNAGNETENARSNEPSGSICGKRIRINREFEDPLLKLLNISGIFCFNL